jgi:hypothetical protein
MRREEGGPPKLAISHKLNSGRGGSELNSGRGGSGLILPIGGKYSLR